MGYHQEAYFVGFCSSIMVFDNWRKRSGVFVPEIGGDLVLGLIVTIVPNNIFDKTVSFHAEAGCVFTIIVSSMSYECELKNFFLY